MKPSIRIIPQFTIGGVMRGLVCAICLSLLCSSVAFAAPKKETPKKGNPNDQTVLDFDAPFVDDSNTKADGDHEVWNHLPAPGGAAVRLSCGGKGWIQQWNAAAPRTHSSAAGH